MNIGLMGLDFGSENLGCGALSYSFLNVLASISEQMNINIDVYVFTQEPCHISEEVTSSLNSVRIIDFHLKKLKTMTNLVKRMCECSYIFDFTAGDSFSDIYGMSRFMKNCFVKYLAVNSTKNYILGPQTIGPFYSALARKIGKDILDKASCIYARDDLSAKYVTEISQKIPEIAIDVAFALPYQDSAPFHSVDGKQHIGLNISALLWNGGYTGKNQFSLNVDYKKYCIKLSEWLDENGYIVHLISHVQCPNFAVEDDRRACEDLQQINNTNYVLSPFFASPMEAKSYISRLDCLVGARMHSTIAALSSGTTVIPFAYSRKFNGLFQTLNYPYVIDGTVLSTEDALAKTKEYILGNDLLSAKAIEANDFAQEKLARFKSSIMNTFLGETENGRN